MDTKQFKQDLLNQLYQPYLNCKACPLGSLGRTQVVFGEGNPDAKLMFIGEGPGEQEDKQGRPFVGRSGQLLNKTLELAGIQRSDVFITNIVKCRPPGNRKPFANESSICKNLLLINQIKIIRPQVICTLGAAAVEGLLDKEVKITLMRGKKIDYMNVITIPTYHPAYILRNPNAFALFFQDIQLAFSLTGS
jgi:uracil-DNA glycosylase